MSAATSLARARSPGMNAWRAYGLHAGMVQCYRNKERHAKWKWGQKKGLRRARRRLSKLIINQELE
jgi:hypothetical protein